ncbi:MAG: leucine-rich repeat domain-containing protein [Candidatus Odinarchaeota archaeon]
MPSNREIEVDEYIQAINTLKQKINANFINNRKMDLERIKKLKEIFPHRDEVIEFMSQILYDFSQINNMVRRNSSTQDKQFQQLTYILALNISDIVMYFESIELILEEYLDTHNIPFGFYRFKNINTFNLIQVQISKSVEENGFDSELVLGFLEDRVMSNSPIVRASAIKALISNYPIRSLSKLHLWVDKEVSTSVVRSVWKDLEKSKNEEHHQLLNRLLQKISKCCYNINTEELKFLLDWNEEQFDFLFPCLDFQMHISYEDILKKYPPTIHVEKGEYGSISTDGTYYPTTFHYKYLKSIHLEEGIVEITIYRGHISGLILRHVTKIPETIGFLTKLKYLSIEDSENLTELPALLENLTNIRYLYFFNTGLKKIPDSLAKLPKLRYLGLEGIEIHNLPDWVKIKVLKHYLRKYLKEGVNENDAYVLGLLEILRGYPLNNVKKDAIKFYIDELEDMYEEADIDKYIDEYLGAMMYYDYYRINNMGYITSIESFSNIRFIPEEIEKLELLKRLHIFSTLPVIIPKSIEPFLNSLEHFYVGNEPY